MKTSKLLEALGFGMHLREGFEKGYASSKKKINYRELGISSVREDDLVSTT